MRILSTLTGLHFAVLRSRVKPDPDPTLEEKIGPGFDPQEKWDPNPNLEKPGSRSFPPNLDLNTSLVNVIFLKKKSKYFRYYVFS